MAMTSNSSKPKGLEKTLADLETLVQRLEAGELSLEAALKEYEKGVNLTRECQTALKDAAQKIEILQAKTTESDPVEFDAGGEA
jgi:exodeoxyribonuclease VII small subunit